MRILGNILHNGPTNELPEEKLRMTLSHLKQQSESQLNISKFDKDYLKETAKYLNYIDQESDHDI